MRRIKSLSLKISFAILLAVILIFSSIILYNYFISRDLLLRNVEQNMKNLGTAEALKIDKMLEASEKIPQNLSFILGMRDYSLDEIKEVLRLTVENNKEIFGCCIAFEPKAFNTDSIYYAPYMHRSGDSMLFKLLNDRSINYFSQDWYRLPKEANAPKWTEPYFDEGGGNILMCTYSVPFYKNNDKNNFQGIVTIDISLQWLADYVQNISAYDQGYAFVISAKGEFITHPLQAIGTRTNVFVLAEERDYDVLRKAAKDMVAGGSDFIPYKTPIIDGDTWLFYTPLKSAGWSMSIIIPEGAFMRDLYQLNKDLLLIGIIGFIILLIIIIYISKRITRPLRALTMAARIIGKGNLDTDLPAIKTEDEIGQLNSSIHKMQAELKNYIKDLQETTAAKEKIESELQIARDIQQGILPKIFPPFPERDSVELFAILNPARDVGGDLYDFFFVDDQHLCFTIGDVSGKGVPASLFMAITRTLLRGRMDNEANISEVLTAMNNELCMENENAMFVTLFLGVLNVDTGHLLFCNAGHNYPLIAASDGTVKELKGTHGTPLGAIPDIIYGSDEVFLNNRESLLLYTDGVSEAIDVGNNPYTEKRLIDKFGGISSREPATIIEEIIKDHDNFVGEADQFDDITMLVISWFKTGK